MKTYIELQSEIGSWSLANFGNQETPYLRTAGRGTVVADTPRDQGTAGEPLYTGFLVCMDSLSPLMGIVEEFGEIADSLLANNKDEIEDAIGDVAVYLCDYLCRECINWPPDNNPLELDENSALGLQSAIGKLCHAHLKRFQRIRGMHDIKAFHNKRSEAVRLLVWNLENYAMYVTGKSLLHILNRVWTGVVAKRNWKKDSTKG